MKKVIAFLLMIALVCSVACAEAIFAPEVQRAMVSTEYVGEVTQYISTFLNRVSAGEKLNKAECELLAAYFQVRCLATNAMTLELNLLKSDEVLPESKTIADTNRTLVNYVILLKDAYLNGEASWEDSMANAIEVIAATIG